MNDAQPWYVANARNLLETRKQGLAPEGPVVVSLVGQSFPHTTLHCRADVPADRLDWRMLVNLDVWVWAGPAATLDWIIATVWRIAQVRPSELLLRFEHADAIHDIDCGTGIHHPEVAHIPAVHQFIWCPINVGGTGLGYRIKDALCGAHRKGQTL